MSSPAPGRVLAVLLVLSLVVSAVGLPVASAAGPVFVETDITQDATWTAEDGPYRIVANVSVAPDATLTIEPGAEVQVAEGISLSVAGELVAEGTPDEPVTFTSPRANLSRGTWGSIRTAGDSSVTVSLRHAVIEYGTDGLRVDNGAIRTTIENVTFADLAGDGVAVTASRSGTDVVITDSTFRDVGGGAVTAGEDGAPVSRISGWRVEDVSVDSVDETALNWHAAKVSGVRIADTRIENATGGAVAIQASELRNSDIASNVITESGDGISASTDVLTGFRITGNTISQSGVGVDVTATRNVREFEIRENSITAGETGVAITHESPENRYFSFSATIARNQLSENTVHGLIVESGFLAPPKLAVHNNTVADNGWFGARFAMGEFRNAEVADNRFARNGEDGFSVAARHVTDSRVHNNTARENIGSGMALEANVDMSALRIEDNRLLDNAGPGIRLGNGEATPGNLTVRNNLVAANAYGVVVAGPQSTRIEQNEIVYNTVSVGPTVPLSRVETGVGIVAAGGHDNFWLHANDIYGHRIGLFTDTGGTVEADDNYWGASSGPYHQSINPEGEGDSVVTHRGWVDIIHAETERIGQSHVRPVARVSVDPQTATVGDTVRVSADGSSDDDGRVTTYHFTIGNETRRTDSPVQTVTVDRVGSLPISVVVADDLGIESATNATATVTVEAVPNTTTETTTSTTTTTTAGTTTTTSTTTGPPPEEQDQGILAAILSFGGLLGALFYLVAMGLGGWGMYQTVAGQPLSVDGRRIHVLALLGIIVWAVASLLGPGDLLFVGLGGLVAWMGLTGIAYLVARGT